MPYMIYQQYKTAVKQAYSGDESIVDLHDRAKACRQWLASLQIEPKLRDPLVEPVAAIEEALHDLLRGHDAQ